MFSRNKKRSNQGESSLKALEKQKLKDLEHTISMDVGTFLVLIEEGNTEQALLARQKTRSALLKYGPDMFHLAEKIGDPYPAFVEEFLQSIDHIVHMNGLIDDAQIKACFKATQKLEKAL